MLDSPAPNSQISKGEKMFKVVEEETAVGERTMAKENV